jgi:transposase-like protein
MHAEIGAERPIGRESCPTCGAERGLIRVEHAKLSGGRTYERYFCASCCVSVEVRGAPTIRPSS